MNPSLSTSGEQTGWEAPASPPANGLKRLVDVREVGRLLNCSPRTVYRLADEGRIPWGVKLGGLRRWDLRQLEEFIEGGCKPVRSLGLWGDHRSVQKTPSSSEVLNHVR
jgi:excisionase family DNA binding protein